MNIAVMIMAAGESKRFGGCKLLTQLDDAHSLLSHAVEQALVSNVGPVFAVTGRWHNEIELAQRKGKMGVVPLLYNEQWYQGLGNSIAYGINKLATDYDAVLITLADQVALNADDYKQLVSLAHPDKIVCSRYNGKRGVPAVFPARFFHQLERFDGDHGARSLLRGEELPVLEMVLQHASYDIDEPQMLMEWQHHNAAKLSEQ